MALFHPISLCIIQPLLESIHYDLVNSLDLSIPLGISWGRVYVLNSQVTAVSPKGLTIKLKTIVRNESVRDLEPGNNVLPEKLFSVHTSDVR